MECPTCSELYAQDRIARNLLCGHTYCQNCLEYIYNSKKRIECPICRHKHEPNVKPNLLTKNFVAMDLASKHSEIRKKLQFCTIHPLNPLQYFCENDQQHMCSDCIIEHSGHKFCKQEHSVPLLKERIENVKIKLKGQYDQLEKQTKTYENAKEHLNQDLKKLVQQLDEQFNKLIERIELRKYQLKDQINRLYQQESEAIEHDQVVNESLLQNMKQTYFRLEQTSKKLDEIQVIKDNSQIQIIDELEELSDRDITQQKQIKSTEYKKLPKLVFDNKIIQEVQKYGTFKKDVSNPQICFFGDKHKILIYNIEKEEWQFKQMPNNSLEYNYYAASASLPNGEVIITGGGVSKNVMLIQPQKGFTSQPLKSMYFPRKEHACVFLDGFVYAIGGYDGASKQMLSCCERYNVAADEWRMIEPLQKQKCAFAAAAAINKYIYVFGGFDGRERLNTIERYSVKDNQWKALELRFKQGFSNAAAIANSDNSILILGGGSNQGFSLDLQQFDIQENQIRTLSRMSEGRDLRNKLIIFDQQLYACGGNSCSMERFSLNQNQWNLLKQILYIKKNFLTTRPYDSFISDNLDSWCSALTFTTENSSPLKQQLPPQKQLYSNDVSFENDSFSQEFIDELSVDNRFYQS